jgi:hypothetical protein
VIGLSFGLHEHAEACVPSIDDLGSAEAVNFQIEAFDFYGAIGKWPVGIDLELAEAEAKF